MLATDSFVGELRQAVPMTAAAATKADRTTNIFNFINFSVLVLPSVRGKKAGTIHGRRNSVEKRENPKCAVSRHTTGFCGVESDEPDAVARVNRRTRAGQRGNDCGRKRGGPGRGQIPGDHGKSKKRNLIRGAGILRRNGGGGLGIRIFRRATRHLATGMAVLHSRHAAGRSCCYRKKRSQQQ